MCFRFARRILGFSGFQVFWFACRITGCQVFGFSGLCVVGVQAFVSKIFTTGFP